MRFSSEAPMIFLNGQFRESAISITHTSNTQHIPDTIRQCAMHTWERIVTDAKKNGSKVWDALLYRLENVHVTASGVHISVSDIPFSLRIGMNHCFHLVQRCGEKCAPKGMFSSSFVVTKDRKSVFIKKSNAYFSEKTVSWIGGVFSKDECNLQSGRDLFMAAAQEIREEIGVPYTCMRDLTLRTVFLTHNWNVCFLFSVSLDVTAHEVAELYHANADGEASGLIFDTMSASNTFPDMQDRDKIKLTLLNRAEEHIVL